MNLLECVAEELHFYLSDFHYKEKLFKACTSLYMRLDTYPLEEWLRAYQYIFSEEKVPHFKNTKEVYEGIYKRMVSIDTDMRSVKKGV